MTNPPNELHTVVIYFLDMEPEQLLKRFTNAQQRALSWLPTNGSARYRPQNYGAAVRFFQLYYPTLVNSDFSPYGQRGARIKGWWLTPEGIEVKKKIEHLLPVEDIRL